MSQDNRQQSQRGDDVQRNDIDFRTPKPPKRK